MGFSYLVGFASLLYLFGISSGLPKFFVELDDILLNKTAHRLLYFHLVKLSILLINLVSQVKKLIHLNFLINILIDDFILGLGLLSLKALASTIGPYLILHYFSDSL